MKDHEEYIDEMLQLTSEIADGLLTIKDSGEDINPELNLKIQQLAVISDRETTAALRACVPTEAEEVEEPAEEEPEVELGAEAEAEAASAEYEEEADADIDNYSEIPEAEEAVENPDEEVAEEESEGVAEESQESTSEETDAEEMATQAEEEEETDADAESIDEAEIVILVEDEGETAVEILREDTDVAMPEQATTTEESREAEIPEEQPREAEVYYEIVEAPKEEPKPDFTVNEAEELEEERREAAPERSPRMSAAELRRGFSLNDTFYYRRTLFHGSASAMDEALEYATRSTGRRDFADYLKSRHGIDVKSESAEEFIGTVASMLS